MSVSGNYELVDGGFEIVNGSGIYNRPLYGPHCRDLESFEERLLGIVGDNPDALMLLINWTASTSGGCSAVKLGHMLLGLKGGKWLHDCERIWARYDRGHQEYELSDPSVEGAIRLAFVRPVEFEGLLVRVELPPGCPELVVACGGGTRYARAQHYDYQGGPGTSKDFHPEDCRDCEVTVEGNVFGTRKPQEDHQRTLYGTATVPLQLAVREAAALADGPDALLAAEAVEQPMAAGVCAATEGPIYLLLTTEDLAQPEIQEYLINPGEVFDACCRHYAELSQSARVDTPDPYLNAGFAAMLLGYDGAWHEPCFTHGPWSWTTPFSGWRVCYGATALGWHDRVQSSTSDFFPYQIREPEEPTLVRPEGSGWPHGAECRGAVPDTARTHRIFYNMGEVLVDHIMYDWEWTGDLEFMSRAFDFVAGKLHWEEKLLDPDGDGLYENWVNTWISDAHWYNGGGCIQASVYNWRANQIMADVARRLGKDPSVFEERAARIRRGCDELLWVADRGLYAEYKDVIGHQRVHESPEQASIYHPIDFWFCDDFQSYQMLRFAEYAMVNEVNTTPLGGRLIWSSDWAPTQYSSLGLYPQETINLLLCYYRLGLTEWAQELLQGVEASFIQGPCPAGIAHNQRPDGSHHGTTDFTDTTSILLRTVVEGLFGVQMKVPEGRVIVQPSFPRDWDHASLQVGDISYDYSWDGSRESIKLSTARELKYRVRLKARTAQVTSLRLDGQETQFTLEPGIGGAWVVLETPPTWQAEIVVEYAEAALPAVSFAPVGAIGERWTVRATCGEIVEVRDPQGILGRLKVTPKRVTARPQDRSGWHTVFVLVRAGEMSAWLPVDVELRPALEIVRPRLFRDAHRVRCSAALRNNTEKKLRLEGRLEIGGSQELVACCLAPGSESEVFEFTPSHPQRLTPGSNRLTAHLQGDREIELVSEAVCWEARGPIRVTFTDMETSESRSLAEQCKPIPLDEVANQDLIHLHDNKYLEPRPKSYSMQVDENGRSAWNWTARGDHVVEPHLELLEAAGGRFMSDIGVPFAVPSTEPNSCFTAIWENFPSKVEIPVGVVGRKVYFLVVASTQQMQSQIENARLTVNFSGGQRVMALVNPQNLDDWLCRPFAHQGYVQYLGEETHGLILDADLGEEVPIESVELETLSNEVMVGLVGVTIV